MTADTPNPHTRRFLPVAECTKSEPASGTNSPVRHEIVRDHLLPSVKEPHAVSMAHNSFSQEHATMSNGRCESATSNVGCQPSGV